jgi:KUP system potassium uptake protein
MNRSNVLRILAECRNHGLAFDIMDTSFFVGRETLVRMRHALAAKDPAALSAWRGQLFIALWNASLSATAFFQIPPGRVVELGIQVEV